jgi:2-polyprenyl-3-methyl-5-hydroxy-6-metoxy-1,4-benzoquinol methylase
MNRKRAIQFCHKYATKRFYQPVVFVPGVIEVKGKWNEATKKLSSLILRNCAGKSILDLGCMHGYFLHEAKKEGADEVVGVDHDIVEVRIAEEINEILDDGVNIVHKDLADYTPDHPFDIVLMMNIIHVLPDPATVINRYLDFCTELVIEHDEGHDKYFPRQPDQVLDSPRSAGHRKLSCFLT